MSDSALDRQLQAALNVEPSPEFLARVRLRVASERPAGGWMMRWPWLAAAGSAAVAVVVAVSVWSGDSREASPAPASAPVNSSAPAVGTGRRRAEAPRVAGAPPTPASQAAPHAASRPPAGDGGRRVARAATETPSDLPPFREVLISRDEVRAYETFIAALQQRRVPPLPPARSTPGAAPEELSDLEIAPLVIEPLPQIARLEIGEGQ